MVYKGELISQPEYQTFSLDLLAVQNKNNIASDMNGEKVLLSIDNGKYYNLGAIGGRIWDMMAYPETIGSIVNTLMDEYEIDRTTCEEQVFSFLTHLSEERLVQFGI
ncbi:lasso peptide biosynthesis PqqD family chaperone [Paenibacillus sp. 1011MAR3C5]|uniref:lasso peptide biosynthesis PqqD family chaperone n=1 Tax=Paenibacillus sp. 1011MAR3C5 TaxID=1675787 RepID=UPI000E6C1665|nr:lasso peptide biosynthesis PqqD family chaperone [Paenibacillus sp. 1011MAR3C5]RJE91140.1 lasso peptide biosynthesis PqqD family chaperone [Paenibacillus sp. 1011MAR3C5]